MTGWTEDLKPGDGGFTGPDGACVGWIVLEEQGQEEETGWNCPHFHPERGPTKAFDYVWRFEYPVTGAELGMSFD